MAEQISRRTFVKGLAAGAASIAALGVLERLGGSASGGESSPETVNETVSAAPEVTNALAESANIDIRAAGLTFTPGTYTASATGLGLVTMTATFDKTSVTDIALDVSNETEDIGQAAANELIRQCLEKQGTEIDGVTGATLTTNAVKRCLRSCILQAAGMEDDASSASSAASDDAWLGEAPDITDDMVEETVTADVLVIGCGVAGVAAVRSAAEEGANVVAVEKGSGPQCRSGEYAVINGGVQARWKRNTWTNEQIEKMVDFHMMESAYKVKRGIISKWAHNIGDAFDWWVAPNKDLY